MGHGVIGNTILLNDRPDFICTLECHLIELVSMIFDTAPTLSPTKYPKQEHCTPCPYVSPYKLRAQSHPLTNPGGDGPADQSPAVRSGFSNLALNLQTPSSSIPPASPLIVPFSPAIHTRTMFLQRSAFALARRTPARAFAARPFSSSVTRCA